MPGSTLGQKQHRIFPAHLVGVVNFSKQFASIVKLRFEGGKHFFAHGVAADTIGGTNGGDEIFGAGTKSQPHAADARLNDAFHSTPPSGMKSSHGMPLWVCHKHRHAICSLYGQQNTCLICHLPVGLARVLTRYVRPGSSQHEIGMKLTEGNQRNGRIARDGLGQQSAVRSHSLSFIFRRESQIEFARCILGAIRSA